MSTRTAAGSKTPLGDAIRAARQGKGLSQEDLASKARVSRNFIANVERGDNVSIDVLERIATALGLDTLPLGKVKLTAVDAGGPAISVNHVESLLSSAMLEIEKARRLLTQPALEPAGDVLAFEPRAKSSTMTIRDGPFVPVSLIVEEEIDVPIAGYVAAGSPVDLLNDGHGETRRVPVSDAPDPRWVALQARGDSMIEFGIYDGDLVYVEPRRGGVAASGEIVIGWLNDGLVIKEWSRKGSVRKLISWNEEYPPRVLTGDDTWELQAIVRKTVPRAIRGREFKPRTTPKISG
jgi:SOS-response transcriptional repressor LexA/DNA-binding XRE family transcriptional regulator